MRSMLTLQYFCCCVQGEDGLLGPKGHPGRKGNRGRGVSVDIAFIFIFIFSCFFASL